MLGSLLQHLQAQTLVSEPSRPYSLLNVPVMPKVCLATRDCSLGRSTVFRRISSHYWVVCLPVCISYIIVARLSVQYNHDLQLTANYLELKKL